MPPKRKASSSPLTASPERGSTRQPQRKIPSFGSSILTIHVGSGSSSQTFYIHETIAIKFSEFFAAAVRNGWNESIERVVKLPEEEPEHFKVFEAFVHTGRICSQKEGDQYIDEENGINRDDEWGRLGEIWLLGDRLQASAFKDAVIDTLIEKSWSDNSFPVTLHTTIYPGSAGTSPMKALLVDIALWDWDTHDLENAKEENCGRDLIVDLAIVQHQHIVDGRPSLPPYKEGSSCNYHEHGHDKPCYKTMFM